MGIMFKSKSLYILHHHRNLLLLLAFILSVTFTQACSNFLITGGVSEDGSNMICYVCDDSRMYGSLTYYPESDHSPDETVRVVDWDSLEYLGDIPQASHTYKVLGHMNQHQLTIAETSASGRADLNPLLSRRRRGVSPPIEGDLPDPGIDYGTLMFLGLQRSKSAREAIDVMVGLATEYGYASGGESYSLGDPNEIWYMELIGRGEEKGVLYVAIRVPDGMVTAHANQFRIRHFPLDDPDNCVYSPDVITFAREKGYFDGTDEEFDWTAAYGPPDFGGLRYCEARVWSAFNRLVSGMDEYLDFALGSNPENPMPLFIRPNRKLTVEDAFALMRDHYEGTAMDMTVDIGSQAQSMPKRFSPLRYEYNGRKYCHERPISTQVSGFSMVSQMRRWLPDSIGGILWFGVDDAACTVHVPIYMAMNHRPDMWEPSTDLYKGRKDSAFFVFNLVANYAYGRWADIYPDVKAQILRLEKIFIQETADKEKIAIDLYSRRPALAEDLLSRYSVERAEWLVGYWLSFFEKLFVKFLDWNTKTISTEGELKIEFPGYVDEWYQRIVDEDGSRYNLDQLFYPEFF